jgi:hypothetical protein
MNIWKRLFGKRNSPPTESENNITLDLDDEFWTNGERQVSNYVVELRMYQRDENPDSFAQKVEDKINLDIPNNMSAQQRKKVNDEVRRFIRKSIVFADKLLK